MSCLQTKFRRLKQAFKVWNKSVFGNLERQVYLAVHEVNRIQNLIDYDGVTYTLYIDNLQARLILTQLLNTQDQFWREKARSQAFIHGDRILPIFTVYPR